jgi:enoyl-CoA hydratase/carnithine racemase
MLRSGHAIHISLLDDSGAARLTLPLLDRLLADVARGGDETMILEGSASVFCEGLDLDSLATNGSAPSRGTLDEAVSRFAALLRALERRPGAVISIVDGPAMGGGVGLAASSDMVIASPRATFALPEAIFGLIPAVIFPAVAARVGYPRARMLALTGRTITAAEAASIGLVDEVADDPHAATAKCVRRLSCVDAHAIAAMKSLVADHFGAPAGYATSAAERFGALAAGSSARARIARFAAGETPWPDVEAG